MSTPAKCPSRLTLDRYRLGELERTAIPPLDQHLSGCTRCSAWIEEQERAAAEFCAHEDSEAFAQAVIDLHRATNGAKATDRALASPARTVDSSSKRPFRWFSWPVLVPSGLLAGAAAALAVVVLSSSSVTLPSYDATISRGTQIQMGADDQAPPTAPRFSTGARIDITLTPAQASPLPVEAQAWAWQGEKLVSLALTHERAASGSLRLRGIVGKDVKLTPGSWQVVIVIAATGELPDEARVRADLSASPPATAVPRGYQRVVRPIVIE